ncbi:ribosomal protein S18-alanine N-acetyltransferase [Chloroflexota bacterium]
MPCYLRMMHGEDILQVAEIDREAFPTQLPPPNFKNELKSKLSHYMVACDGERLVEQPGVPEPSGGGLKRLVSGLRRLFSGSHFSNNGSFPATGHYIAGYIGCWVLADEAHITTIAVREECRRQGIGELLLIAAIELAAQLRARILTLEVRVSNTTAQSLYKKYGFNKVGIRKGYYTDNREDAMLMSTESINTAQFKREFEDLKQAHSRRYGIEDHRIAR